MSISSDVGRRRKQLYPVMRILKKNDHATGATLCQIRYMWTDNQRHQQNTMHLNYQQDQRYNRTRDTSVPFMQDRKRPRTRPPADNVLGLLNFETPVRYTPLRERSQSLQIVRKHKVSPLEDTNYKRTFNIKIV